jgi:hypothetical protein
MIGRGLHSEAGPRQKHEMLSAKKTRTKKELEVWGEHLPNMQGTPNSNSSTANNNTKM